MKFKIDENLPMEVAELLRQTGYDATTVLEQDLGGSLDTDLASLCQKERRVFVTLGTDFGNCCKEVSDDEFRIFG
jgi:predicted nuclease of predicted toxin-antitoxin system